jgi:hypothetical protein
MLLAEKRQSICLPGALRPAVEGVGANALNARSQFSMLLKLPKAGNAPKLAVANPAPV